MYILLVRNAAPGSVTICHDVEYSVTLLHGNDVISPPRGTDEMITQLLFVFSLQGRRCTQTLNTQTCNEHYSQLTNCYTHTLSSSFLEGAQPRLYTAVAVRRDKYTLSLDYCDLHVGINNLPKVVD